MSRGHPSGRVRGKVDGFDTRFGPQEKAGCSPTSSSGVFETPSRCLGAPFVAKGCRAVSILRSRRVSPDCPAGGRRRMTGFEGFPLQDHSASARDSRQLAPCCEYGLSGMSIHPGTRALSVAVRSRGRAPTCNRQWPLGAVGRRATRERVRGDVADACFAGTTCRIATDPCHWLPRKGDQRTSEKIPSRPILKRFGLR